jgi:hypothetical protein
MDDAPLLEQINSLYQEEEALYAEASAGGGLSGDDQARLADIKVRLDQAYDLLHQRQAKRAAGEDPDEARMRPVEVVEDYEQ